MQPQLIQCVDKLQWDHFVSISPQGNVFCQTAFLDALDAGYELWLLIEGEKILAGAVLLHDEYGCILPAPQPFCMYQGLLLGTYSSGTQIHRHSKEILETTTLLLERLEQQGLKRLSFCLHPEFDDVRAISWFHYHQPEKGMFHIDLRYSGWLDLRAAPDFDAYLATIRPTRRNEYRRAKRMGLTAEISDDIETMDRLHQLTFERQGIARHDGEAELLNSITSAAITKGFGELMIVRLPDGEAASATLFLHDNKCSYYLVGANHPEHRNTFSGTYAFLENVRHAYALGLDRVDVCGINSPNRGDFKISFNAAPRAYFVTEWQACS